MKSIQKKLLLTGLLAATCAMHACIPFTGGSASSLLDVALANSTPISTSEANEALNAFCADRGQALIQKLGSNGEVHFQAGYTQHFDLVGASYGLGLDSSGNLLRSGNYREYSRSSQLMLPPHEEFNHGDLIRSACKTVADTLSGSGYPRSEAVRATVSGSLAHGQANLGQCVGIVAANPQNNTEASILFCENGVMQKAETSGAGVGNKSAIVMQTKS